MESISNRGALKRHVDGFRDLTNRKFRKGDIALHYGVPALAFPAWIMLAPKEVDLSALISGITILTGLFFALLVFVFQLRLDIPQSVSYQRSARLPGLIDILFHNTAYATLVGLLACISTVSVDLLPRAPQWTTGITMALCVHLVLTTALLVRRVQAAYVQLVNDKARASKYTAK